MKKLYNTVFIGWDWIDDRKLNTPSNVISKHFKERHLWWMPILFCITFSSSHVFSRIASRQTIRFHSFGRRVFADLSWISSRTSHSVFSLQPVFRMLRQLSSVQTGISIWKPCFVFFSMAKWIWNSHHFWEKCWQSKFKEHFVFYLQNHWKWKKVQLIKYK